MAVEKSDKAEPGLSPGLSQGFGASLREAREAQGISLGDMAAHSRLSVPQLQALEAEEVDKLPEPVYVRAFIRGVASTLKLDAEPLVADYCRRFGAGNSGVVPERSPETEPVISAKRSNLPLTAGVIVLLLAAVAAGGWSYWSPETAAPENAPAVQSAAAPEGAKSQPTAAAGEAAPAPVETKPAEVPAEAPAAAAGNTPAAAAPAENAAPAQQKEPTAAPAQTASQPAESVQPAPAAVTPTVRRAVLETSAPCWVHIVPPGGKALLAREMKAGDRVELEMPIGSRITIGNRDAMLMTLDGATFDLSQYARAGIARFTLK